MRAFLVSLLLLGAVCAAEEVPAFFQKPLLAGAHRGGALLWPENTVYAFEQAASRWPDLLLETDVRISKDGHAVLMHDATVDRTTDGKGAVEALTLEALRALDAGYTFTQDGGATFPFRGKGLQIPTLEEVLKGAPEHRFLVELKGKEAGVPPFLAAIEAQQAWDRVVIASFNAAVMEAIRRQQPEAMLCFDMNTGHALLLALRTGDWNAYTPPALLLSVTTELHRQFQIKPEEIARIQAKGIVYQLHTLNTRAEMEAAMESGIQSILTDDPALLHTVIQEQRAGVRPPGDK